MAKDTTQSQARSAAKPKRASVLWERKQWQDRVVQGQGQYKGLSFADRLGLIAIKDEIFGGRTFTFRGTKSRAQMNNIPLSTLRSIEKRLESGGFIIKFFDPKRRSRRTYVNDNPQQALAAREKMAPAVRKKAKQLALPKEYALQKQGVSEGWSPRTLERKRAAMLARYTRRAELDVWMTEHGYADAIGEPFSADEPLTAERREVAIEHDRDPETHWAKFVAYAIKNDKRYPDIDAAWLEFQSRKHWE